ncbi:unnamed protein product, partial [Laminaria digitata]
MGRCSHDLCTRQSTFNLVGSKTPACCKLHAEDGMVDVLSKPFGHEAKSTFNLVGSKTLAYCKQHAEDGPVNVRHRRCLHDSCTRLPSFNFLGSKRPVYCK